MLAYETKNPKGNCTEISVDGKVYRSVVLTPEAQVMVLEIHEKLSDPKVKAREQIGLTVDLFCVMFPEIDRTMVMTKLDIGFMQEVMEEITKKINNKVTIDKIPLASVPGGQPSPK